MYDICTITKKKKLYIVGKREKAEKPGNSRRINNKKKPAIGKHPCPLIYRINKNEWWGGQDVKFGLSTGFPTAQLQRGGTLVNFSSNGRARAHIYCFSYAPKPSIMLH
jgi:hypothetical protein